MDKYEYRLSTQEMLSCVSAGDYKKAESIADSIDWRKVKSVSMLSTVSSIYEECGRYEDAREILFIAYDRAPNSRKIIFGLAELALKMGDIAEAKDCYGEFRTVAPNDGNQYVLKYEIAKAAGEPVSNQIKALEEFKNVEYVERWAYELAKLYERAGMTEKCIEECDDLVLWFSDGRYVRKALELKRKYRPLTGSQLAKYMENADEKAELKESQRAAEMLLDDEKKIMAAEAAEAAAAAEAEAKAAEAKAAALEKSSARRATDPAAEFLPEESEDLVSEATPDAELAEEAEITSEAGAEEPEKAVKARILPFRNAFRKMKEEAVRLKDSFASSEREDAFEPIPDVPADEAYEAPEESEESEEEISEELEMSEEVEESVSEAAPSEATDYAEALRHAGYGANYERSSRYYEPSGDSALEEEPEAPEEEVQEVSFETKDTPQQTDSSPYNVEDDGQFTLAGTLGSEEPQVSGQLNITDMLAQWEEKKRSVEREIEETRFQNAAAALADDEESILSDDKDENGEKSRLIPDDIRKLLWQLENNIDPEPEESEETESAEDAAEDSPLSENDQDDVPVSSDVEEAAPETQGDAAPEAGEADEEAAEDTDEAAQAAEDVSGTVIAEPEEVNAEPVEADESEETAAESEEAVEPEETAEEAIDFSDDDILAGIAAALEGAAEAQAEPEEAKAEGVPAAPAETGSKPAEIEEVTIPETPEEKQAREAAEAARAKKPLSATQELRLAMEEKFDLEAQGRVGLEAGLTEEQKKAFSYFVPVRGMSEQLVKALEKGRRGSADGTSGTGNILVYGPKGCGKTMLGLTLVKQIRKEQGQAKGKAAMIRAASLNKKDVPETIRKVHGGALLIEEAGELTPHTVKALDLAMNTNTDGLIVVLEDSKDALRPIMKQNEFFSKKFNIHVRIPDFINDELVTFGQAYAKEHGYKIDDMGILALYSRIDVMQRDDHSVTIAEVKDIMDAAFIRSKKNSMRKTMTNLFKKDSGQLTTLEENDFAR